MGAGSGFIPPPSLPLPNFVMDILDATTQKLSGALSINWGEARRFHTKRHQPGEHTLREQEVIKRRKENADPRLRATLPSLWSNPDKRYAVYYGVGFNLGANLDNNDFLGYDHDFDIAFALPGNRGFVAQLMSNYPLKRGAICILHPDRPEESEIIGRVRYIDKNRSVILDLGDPSKSNNFIDLDVNREQIKKLQIGDIVAVKGSPHGHQDLFVPCDIRVVHELNPISFLNNLATDWLAKLGKPDETLIRRMATEIEWANKCARNLTLWDTLKHMQAFMAFADAIINAVNAVDEVCLRTPIVSPENAPLLDIPPITLALLEEKFFTERCADTVREASQSVMDSRRATAYFFNDVVRFNRLATGSTANAISITSLSFMEDIFRDPINGPLHDHSPKIVKGMYRALQDDLEGDGHIFSAGEFLEALFEWAGISENDPYIKETAKRLRSTNEKMMEIYSVGFRVSEESVYRAIGAHLGSEFFAHTTEFRILWDQFQDMIKGIDEQKLRYLADHVPAEEAHFQAALDAAIAAIACSKDPAYAQTWILEGVEEYKKMQQNLYKTAGQTASLAAKQHDAITARHHATPHRNLLNPPKL